MKKCILVAAVMCLMFGKAEAGDKRNTPYGPSQALASADYGGVDVSTLSLSASLKLAFIGEGVFHGVNMTTPTALNEYVDVFDSSSTTVGLDGGIGDYPQSSTFIPIARIYNSTQAVTSPGTVYPGNVIGLKYPLRVKNGLVFKYQVNTLYLLSVLYTKYPDQ